LAIAGVAMAQPAAALTMQQCGAKYKAAQTAGTLNGMSWQQFRKANCGPGASTLATAPATNSPMRSVGAAILV
jgi:hypothetical protein